MVGVVSLVQVVGRLQNAEMWIVRIRLVILVMPSDACLGVTRCFHMLACLLALWGVVRLVVLSQANVRACEWLSGCLCWLAPCLCIERSTHILFIVAFCPLWLRCLCSVPVLPTYQMVSVMIGKYVFLPHLFLGMLGDFKVAHTVRVSFVVCRRLMRHACVDCSHGYGVCYECRVVVTHCIP